MPNDYGIKVTKNGVSVLTATSPKDFNLHSAWPLLKVYKYGTFTKNWTSPDYYDIAHDLGYKPFVLVYMQWFDSINNVLSTDYRLLDNVVNGASYSYEMRADIYTDKIRISYEDSWLDKFVTLSGFYYIFHDQI
jgi:hypothetical protein